MIIPVQAKNVNRVVFSTHAVLNDSAIDPSGFLQRRQIGPGSPGDAVCYLRCRLNGGHDLICRWFCGLRPFTIGGLLIAD
jgi:hypothetical protein